MITIDSLQLLLEKDNVVLGLDAYGVIYNNSTVFDHSVTVTNYCEQHNIPLYLMTNNATQSVSQISNKLFEFGIRIAPENVISSGCGCYMLPDIQAMIHDKNVYVYGYTGSVYYPLQAGGNIVDNVEDAQCIVMAASLMDRNHRVYKKCFDHLLNNDSVDVICINPDHYVSNYNNFMPVMGFYAHQMEIQLNRHWVWMGKPYSSFSDLVRYVLNRDGHNENSLVFCDDNPFNVQQMITDLNCSGCIITDTGVYSKYSSTFDEKNEFFLPVCRL